MGENEIDENENNDYGDFGRGDDEDDDGDEEGEEEQEKQRSRRPVLLSEEYNNLHIPMDDDIDLTDNSYWPERVEDFTPKKGVLRRVLEYIKDESEPVVAPLKTALGEIEAFLAKVFDQDHDFKVHHVFEVWDALIHEHAQHINNGIKSISKTEPRVKLYERKNLDKNDAKQIAKIIMYDIFAIDQVMNRKNKYGRYAKEDVLNPWFKSMHELSFITGLTLARHIKKCLAMFDPNLANKKFAEGTKKDSAEEGEGEDNNEYDNEDDEKGKYIPTAYTPEKKYSSEKLLELTIKAVKKNRPDVFSPIIKKLYEYGMTEINKSKKRKLKDRLMKYFNLSKKVNTNIKEIKEKLKNIKS